MIYAQDILNSARAFIDEYNIGGVVIPSNDSDMRALESNGLKFITSALNEIFNYSKNLVIMDIDCTANTSNEIYTVYDMPDDFGGVDEIINLTHGQILDYRWVAYGKLYMRNTYRGIASVVYNVMPAKITDATDVVKIPNPIALEFVNNFVAAKMATTENPKIVNFLESKANELLMKIAPIQPADEEPILNVY